ncbi:MAG: nicotinamide riboside transporter PnuC [Bacillaceae bacterium]|nr:nicotinamide riboside transporter PnuC [Bacillaceae bacterium]
MKLFKDWNLFEKCWLLLFTLINVYLFFAWSDSLLGLISSMTGMLCVVLVAKGKISNYYFGVIQTCTYAYIAYTYGLYGEAMLNGLFYFPLQFVGIYIWNQRKINREESVQGEDIKVKRLTRNQWFGLIGIMVVAWLLYSALLEFIGGRSVGIDSATNVLSVTAQLLLLKKIC